MNLPKRIRNIAISQINSIKDRLDRVDAEEEERAIQRRYERDARAELDDLSDIRLPMRTPEEIAGGKVSPVRKAEPVPGATSSARPAATDARQASVVDLNHGSLSHHYKVLGVEDGADFATVQAAYSKLAARCAPDRFPEDTDARKSAEEILKRVNTAFDALRDALDSTAGRFDKLEF